MADGECADRGAPRDDADRSVHLVQSIAQAVRRHQSAQSARRSDRPRCDRQRCLPGRLRRCRGLSHSSGHRQCRSERQGTVGRLDDGATPRGGEEPVGAGGLRQRASAPVHLSIYQHARSQARRGGDAGDVARRRRQGGAGRDGSEGALESAASARFRGGAKRLGLRLQRCEKPVLPVPGRGRSDEQLGL